jgi:bifunctional polynucleotide phosphatase/kinase
VIFTNQNGISKGNVSKLWITDKILALSAALSFPLQALVATSDDIYRKPSTNMFNYLQTYLHHGAADIDYSASFYVGDAAGRAAGWDGRSSTKKDFSCSDRKFAKNCNLMFYTPEEFFLGHKAADFSWEAEKGKGIQTSILDMFAPKNNNAGKSKKITANNAEITNLNSNNTDNNNNNNDSNNDNNVIKGTSAVPATTPNTTPVNYTKTSQELVLFVGFPASGKSTFARQHFVPAGYYYINQDTLKSKEKCVSMARQALQSGQSVVVDNTNPAPETRALYISAAKKLQLETRVFWFQASEGLAKHLNIYREKLTQGVYKHIPRIAYNLYKKSFQEPKESEGIKEIVKIQFEPEFKNEHEKALFEQLT